VDGHGVDDLRDLGVGGPFPDAEQPFWNDPRWSKANR